jgi:hypothetical protein
MHKERYQEHQDTSQSMSYFMRKYLDLYLALKQEPMLFKNIKYQDYLNESSILLIGITFDIHRFIREIGYTLESTFYDDEWLGICRRRSGIEALEEMYANTCFAEYLPKFKDEDLDYMIQGKGRYEGYLSDEEIPIGIPQFHWWWWYPEQPRTSTSA